MNVTARSDGNCIIIDLSGKFLTYADALELRNAVTTAARKQSVRIVLDLGKVDYIDSFGIGELINSFLHVKSQGGRLALMDLPRRVRNLLVVAKLDTVLEILPDNESAFAAFRENLTLPQMCA